MRKFLLPILLLIFICINYELISQKKVKKKENTSDPTEINISTKKNNAKELNDPYNLKFLVTKPEHFFPVFNSMGNPRSRGEFETLEEYNKRLPAPHDTSKIYYFVVNHNFEYKYDIDYKELRFFAGEKRDLRPLSDYSVPNSLPTRIEVIFEDKGTYEASNSYGKTVTVKKTWATEYVLYLLNYEEFVNNLDYSTGKFKISCIKEPKEAERLSKETEMIIAVKFIEYQQSHSECVFTSKPKIDDPKEMSLFNYNITAKLEKIILWDKTKKEIVVEASAK